MRLLRGLGIGGCAVLVAVLSFAVTGCSCTAGPDALRVLGPETAKVGQTVQFNAAIDRRNTDGEMVAGQVATHLVAWKVTGGSGARIDEQGAFSATQPGVYTVIATKGSLSSQANITVLDEQDAASDSSDTLLAEDTPEPADPATLEMHLLAGNGMGVENGGKPVPFTIEKPLHVREIWTYHYNDGKGASPGAITITGPDGAKEYRPNRTGPGQGGVPNAYWIVDVDFTIEPGQYTLTDSDPGTWSTNADCGGRGMAWFMVAK